MLSNSGHRSKNDLLVSLRLGARYHETHDHVWGLDATYGEGILRRNFEPPFAIEVCDVTAHIGPHTHRMPHVVSESVAASVRVTCTLGSISLRWDDTMFYRFIYHNVLNNNHRQGLAFTSMEVQKTSRWRV